MERKYKMFVVCSLGFVLELRIDYGSVLRKPGSFGLGD